MFWLHLPYVGSRGRCRALDGLCRTWRHNYLYGHGVIGLTPGRCQGRSGHRSTRPGPAGHPPGTDYGPQRTTRTPGPAADGTGASPAQFARHPTDRAHLTTKDKPRVERAMPYVRDSFWRGREFTSLAQMQAAAIAWCREVANVRSHRSLGGASPVSGFDAAEAAALKPLPHNEFVLATWSAGKVGVDCHVKVGKALYSVPWRLMGQQVHARSAGNTMQILHQGK